MTSPDKLNVLLVDDNEATNTLITALLRREYDIDVATDGGEAIEKLKVGRYSTILLDLRMPRKDGFEVLDYLAAVPEALKKVIVVTASVTPHDRERVRKYPVFALVPKPFEIDRLLSIVHECARRHGGSGIAGALSTGTVLVLAGIIRQTWM